MLAALKKLVKKRKPAASKTEQQLCPADFDAKYVDIIKSVQEYTMTSAERIYGLCKAVDYIQAAGIQGDIVECGVWRGGSMMATASTLQLSGDNSRTLHLFDTFDGMSEPTENDVTLQGVTADELMQTEQKSNPKSVWCVSHLDEVRANMQSTGYPAERVHLHRGKVEDTIPELAPEKIALLRLDTDFYESTRHELQHLFPLLADGGVLIVDDYGHWQGARQAVDEYFEEHNIGMMLNRLDYTGRIGIHHTGVTRKHAERATRADAA